MPMAAPGGSLLTSRLLLGDGVGRSSVGTWCCWPLLASLSPLV